MGLVDRPEGETRSARYSPKHLEQLLQIRKWTQAGLSLERIRELLKGVDLDVPSRPVVSGSLEVKSHLTVADGIEVVIEPGRAGLSPEQVRALVKKIMSAHSELTRAASSVQDAEK